MARSIDFSSLTKPERVVLGVGIGQLVNGMIPWWYRIVTTDGSVSYNAGLTNWGVVAVIAGAAAALLVGVRASIWPEPAPRQDGTAYAVLGALGAIVLAAKGVGDDAAWLGVWFGLFLALVLTGAGLWRRSERRAGWT